MVSLFDWFYQTALNEFADKSKDGKIASDDYHYAISNGVNLYFVAIGVRKAYLSEFSFNQTLVSENFKRKVKRELKKYPQISVFHDIIYNNKLVTAAEVKRVYQTFFIKTKDAKGKQDAEEDLGNFLGFDPCSGELSEFTNKRFGVSFEIIIKDPKIFGNVQIYGFVCDRPEGITKELKTEMKRRAKVMDTAIKKINKKWRVIVDIRSFVRKP